MRRLLAVVAVLFLSACSDRHAQGPFGPFGSVTASSQDESQGFWLSGYTWTLSDGVTTCTNVEDYDGIKDNDGTVCNGGPLIPWEGSNTELFPVVEICRLLASGLCSEEDRTFFIRKAREIDVPNLNNGKYVLGDAGEEWWAEAVEGATYRVIVAITFTGLAEDKVTSVAAWDASSPKVLGYFDKVKKKASSAENSNSSDLRLRFRISSSALCDEPCVATAFDPKEEYTLILDKDLEQQDEVGVVGIKFPELAFLDPTKQTQINVIFERIKRADLEARGERCLVDADGNSRLPSGFEEVEDCYSVRTEPFIDLNPTDDEDYAGPLIQFVICTDRPTALLKIFKWSYVKKELDTELKDVDGDFMDCGNLASAAHAAPRHLAGFSGIRSRLMAAATSVLMPAPLHARRRTSRMSAGLESLSRITLVQANDIQVNFTTPLAAGTGFDDANLGEVDGVFTVKVQCLSQVSGTCPATAISVPGTAGWDNVNQVYQVNWNTPKTQPAGEYAAQVYRDATLVAGSRQFSIRSSGSGPSYYTHNAGRTLPIKFFLSLLE
jgi:hypothetical protein